MRPPGWTSLFKNNSTKIVNNFVQYTRDKS